MQVYVVNAIHAVFIVTSFSFFVRRAKQNINFVCVQFIVLSFFFYYFKKINVKTISNDTL